MQFFFDYISPNAYIAWTRIRDLAEKHDRKLELVPVLFAALLDAHGRRGPAEVPALMSWMLENILRKCHRLDIPFEMPHSHPFRPLIPLRLTCLPGLGDKQSALVDRLFRAIWAESLDINDPAVLTKLVGELGMNSEQVFTQLSSQTIKDRLKHNTAQAIERGVFGVPTVLVDDELFWGYDDFVYLDDYLEGKDFYDKEKLKAWSKVKSSASRKG